MRLCVFVNRSWIPDLKSYLSEVVRIFGQQFRTIIVNKIVISQSYRIFAGRLKHFWQTKIRLTENQTDQKPLSALVLTIFQLITVCIGSGIASLSVSCKENHPPLFQR